MERVSALPLHHQPDPCAVTCTGQPSHRSIRSTAPGWLCMDQMQLVSRLISSIWHMGSQSRRETTAQCWEYMSCQHRSGRPRDRDEWRPLSRLNLCLHTQRLPEDRPTRARRLGHEGSGSSAKDTQRVSGMARYPEKGQGLT